MTAIKITKRIQRNFFNFFDYLWTSTIDCWKQCLNEIFNLNMAGEIWCPKSIRIFIISVLATRLKFTNEMPFSLIYFRHCHLRNAFMRIGRDDDGIRCILFFHSFTYLFTHSFIHLLIHSLAHSLTRSFFHSFME